MESQFHLVKVQRPKKSNSFHKAVMFQDWNMTWMFLISNLLDPWLMLYLCSTKVYEWKRNRWRKDLPKEASKFKEWCCKAMETHLDGLIHQDGTFCKKPEVKTYWLVQCEIQIHGAITDWKREFYLWGTDLYMERHSMCLTNHQIGQRQDTMKENTAWYHSNQALESQSLSMYLKKMKRKIVA